jgi:hypothetical protein
MDFTEEPKRGRSRNRSNFPYGQSVILGLRLLPSRVRFVSSNTDRPQTFRLGPWG